MFKKLFMLVLTVFSLIYLLFIAGCSSSPKSEREIVTDVKNHHSFFNVQELTIDNIDIYSLCIKLTVGSDHYP